MCDVMTELGLGAGSIPQMDQAHVPRGRVSDYLLTAPGKAQFFARYGFKAADVDALADALQEHGATESLVWYDDTAYGAKLIVEGPLQTPGGQRPSVRTVWLAEAGDWVPVLLTVYPVIGTLP